VTRDRLYIDAMQQVYSNVTKVMVDSKQGSNLLYLPLDKLLQMTSGVNGSGVAAPAAGGSEAPAQQAVVPPTTSTSDPRSRDGLRSRDRDAR
jgi:membrane protease subunit HflK